MQFGEVLTIIGGTATLLGGLAAFMWVQTQGIYRRIEHNRNNSDQKFLDMADEATSRHHDNLAAFEKIRICLAKAGMWNGNGK